jgi:hypothetical protein
MLQMPLPRMVSFRRSILNTGELGNNQNVPPASVAICHFPALPTPTTTDSGVDFGRARPRAWGSRKKHWACEAHAEKWEVNRCLQSRTPASSIATRSFREPAQPNGICHFCVCSGAGWVKNNLKSSPRPNSVVTDLVHAMV